MSEEIIRHDTAFCKNMCTAYAKAERLDAVIAKCEYTIKIVADFEFVHGYAEEMLKIAKGEN
jgi:isocitrate lyase